MTFGTELVDSIGILGIFHGAARRLSMGRKVKSVRIPEELAKLDLTGIVRECENYLRDLESATLLKQQGNGAAAKALIRTRVIDLGKKIARKVWEARVEYGTEKVAKNKKDKE